MEPMTPLARLAEDLAAGRTTSRALTEAALARIEDPDGEGSRTFIHVHRDYALAAAEASDRLRALGAVPSPLAGIPVSVKDLCDIAGQTTLAGSIVLRNARPATRDATVVARLRAAGAVIVGTTNMTEFAYGGLGINPHHGDCRNPYDRATGRIPGGSSSGAAVSVTDGMAAAALGTDTAGSVRIPAAFCGLAGFKPTVGRIPVDGVYPLGPTMDSVGPLAPTIACCALVDAVFAGEPPTAPDPIPLAGLRFLVPETVVTEDLEPAVADAFESALAALSAAGVRIDRASLPVLSEIHAEMFAFGGSTSVEAWSIHRARIEDESLRAQYDPRISKRMLASRDIRAVDFYEYMRFRDEAMARVSAITRNYDAVAMPTLAITAPPIADFLRDDAARLETMPIIIRNTHLANLLHRTALTIPCHPPGTAPVGFMLMGEADADKRLLAIGQSVEAALAAARR